MSWHPAASMRDHEASRVVLLNIPEASVTTKTSNPSSRADKAGNVAVYFQAKE
jgi:hypothetical protein